MCRIDTYRVAGIVAARRSPTSCISGGESGSAARSHRFIQPRDLALQEAVGPTQVGEVDGGRVDGVEVGEGVDDGESDPPTDVGVLGHRRRARSPQITTPGR